MQLRVREYLQHILDEAHYLSFTARDISQAEFLQDATLTRAFIRSLEVIGEAVKRLPEDVRDQYPQIEWRAIAGMRDRLIHGYFGVDYEIVWDVVVNKIPILITAIEAMLERDDIK